MNAPIPTFQYRDAFLLAGLRRSYSHSEAKEKIPQQWRDFRATDFLPSERDGSWYGVICGTESNGFEYMCAVEVCSFEQLPEHLGRMRVPAQRYAVFRHNGHTSEISGYWRAALEWLSGSEFESSHTPDFEHYGIEFDSEAGVGAVEIWIGITPRGIGAQKS